MDTGRSFPVFDQSFDQIPSWTRDRFLGELKILNKFYQIRTGLIVSDSSSLRLKMKVLYLNQKSVVLFVLFRLRFGKVSGQMKVTLLSYTILRNARSGTTVKGTERYKERDLNHHSEDSSMVVPS